MDGRRAYACARKQGKGAGGWQHWVSPVARENDHCTHSKRHTHHVCYCLCQDGHLVDVCLQAAHILHGGVVIQAAQGADNNHTTINNAALETASRLRRGGRQALHHQVMQHGWYPRQGARASAGSASPAHTLVRHGEAGQSLSTLTSTCAESACHRAIPQHVKHQYPTCMPWRRLLATRRPRR